MSAQSIHKQLERRTHTSVSRSKVYGLLKRLYQMNMIHRYYDNYDQAQHSVIAVEWGLIKLEKVYDNVLLNKEKTT
jgi:predicted transcriptional regulator